MEKMDMTEWTDMTEKLDMMEKVDMMEKMEWTDDMTSLVEEPFNSPSSGYEDLWVWKKSMELVNEVYAVTKKLPDDEKFGLKSQLRRAAVSVPSNIAEGWGRNKRGHFLQGLSYSRGSLHEVETQLRICSNLGYMNPTDADGIISLCGALSAAILKLMNKS